MRGKTEHNTLVSLRYYQLVINMVT